jgi:Tol biopolymer transport system component
MLRNVLQFSKPLSSGTALFLLHILLHPMNVYAAQSLERVSINSNSLQANGISIQHRMSADGRFIAFGSEADNLVGNDTNGFNDIFVRDTVLGLTERVSLDSAGTEGNEASYVPSISADGRYISFQSEASNLVSGDTNGESDIFVRDRYLGTTQRVSISSLGEEGNFGSSWSSLSASGQYIVFQSWSTNLIPLLPNAFSHIYVHDLLSATTRLVSKSSTGQVVNVGNGSSFFPSFSADGRFIAFQSWADNLVPGDTTGYPYHDIFVHDILNGNTERVSVDSAGVEGNAGSSFPMLSADGNSVVFDSLASNLVHSDTNGIQDIFVHNRALAVTSRISIDTFGVQTNGTSYFAFPSADGRFVVFGSLASNLVPGDTNSVIDGFIRDQKSGTTSRVGLGLGGAEPNGRVNWISISPDGGLISFGSQADNLVIGDTNSADDIFLQSRPVGVEKNTIVLSGPYSGVPGTGVELSWYAEPPNSTFYLFYSLTRTGVFRFGHSFDLGSPATLLATGSTSLSGRNSYMTGSIPSQASGRVIYFEIAIQDSANDLWDSIVHEVYIQ